MSTRGISIGLGSVRIFRQEVNCHLYIIATTAAGELSVYVDRLRSRIAVKLPPDLPTQVSCLVIAHSRITLSAVNHAG